MIKEWLTNHFSRPTLVINYFFVALIFALNFAGSSALKWVFLVYTAFVFVTVGLLNLSTSLTIIFTFCFLEGQGRILWGYHPFFRIAFDLVVAMALIRSVLDGGRPNALRILPLPLLFLLLLHVLWYLVQIFNPNSVSLFAPIAATKIYIFPFLVFLMFRNNGAPFEENKLESLSGLVMILILLESILALLQMQRQEAFMLGISPHYLAAMKTDVFVGDRFRPFGTTFVPGAVAVYIFLGTGFLFLRRKFTKRYLIALGGVLFVAGLTLLICQVRSAMIKFGLVTLASGAAIAITSGRSRIEMILWGLKFLSVIAAIVTGLFLFTPLGTYVNLAPGLERWEKIDSFEAFKARRAGPMMALYIAGMRLSERPLGIGPGLTGAASSVSQNEIQNDPVYDRETFWGYDNLFLSLIVEFGYGAFFYIFLVLGVPILLLLRAIRLYRGGHLYRSRVAIVCLAQVSVILLGNWGAIGLPYNPESYFFWFWTALGLNIHDFVFEPTGGQVHVPA